MYGLVLIGLAIAGALSGWLLGSLKRRRRWLIALVVPFPLWLYLPLSLPAGILGSERGLFTWLEMLAMLGYPMLSWTIPAAFGVLIARRDSKRAPRASHHEDPETP